MIITTVSRPACAIARIAPSTSSASSGESTEVGSSRISSRLSAYSCLMISAFCFCPAASAETGTSSGSANGVVAMNRRISSIRARQSTTADSPPFASAKFSATVIEGTSVKCW